MSVVSLTRRLHKLEAKRRFGGEQSGYFIWGRTAEDIAALEGGLDAEPFRTVRVFWPYEDEPPAPRWSTVSGLSDRELEALITVLSSNPDEPPTDLSWHREWSDAQLGNAIIAGLFGRPAMGVPA